MNEHQYTSLLRDFKAALEARIPYVENCLVQFHQEPDVVMQYGPYAVVCSLQTESSGEDRYIIHRDQEGFKFIRDIRKGDNL